MKKQNVEVIVRELARQNFNLYPESYPIEDGLATNEATENAQDLAKNYWDNRTELDEERDNGCGVSKIDYVEWVCAEFSDWVQEEIEA